MPRHSDGNLKIMCHTVPFCKLCIGIGTRSATDGAEIVEPCPKVRTLSMDPDNALDVHVRGYRQCVRKLTRNQAVDASLSQPSCVRLRSAEG
jgi:hypothetical protein